MAPQTLQLLPQADEDSLHNIARLLSIESRPYQRVSSRLLKPDALDIGRPVQLPSPPPDTSSTDQDGAARDGLQTSQIEAIRTWQRDIVNEIALLDYAILRMEFTTRSNKAERDRYAAEKTAITAKQQHVRVTIDELRVQLQAAKETLAVRKTYDALTEKITGSKMLKPRDEQAAAHAKLDEEIADLQLEAESFTKTWAERRMQFGRIEDEAKEMLRMIKDDKEEAERKEGMMKDGDENDDGEVSTARGGASHAGTPRPDVGGASPMHHSQAEEHTQTPRVPQDRLAPLNRLTSAAASPAARSSLDDSPMADAGAHADDASSIEEGEEAEDGGPLDPMET